jgi:hypothetical protein
MAEIRHPESGTTVSVSRRMFASYQSGHPARLPWASSFWITLLETVNKGRFGSNLRVRGDHSAITPRMTRVEITAPG